MAKYVNVHRTTINEWELGHATPRGVWRERYADVLRQLQVADTDRAGDDDAA